MHVKKTTGSDDAEIVIAIWSLNRQTSSQKRYKMPPNVYFDCYTDADVDLNDKLRFEIYLPEGTNYHLGGAYLLRQMTPGNVTRSYPPPNRPSGPPRDDGPVRPDR